MLWKYGSLERLYSDTEEEFAMDRSVINDIIFQDRGRTCFWYVSHYSEALLYPDPLIANLIWDHVYFTVYPTSPFPILELWNPSYNDSELHKIYRSTDFEALKLWKGSSGVLAWINLGSGEVIQYLFYNGALSPVWLLSIILSSNKSLLFWAWKRDA